MSFERPDEFNVDVDRERLPARLYHCAPRERREQILADGLDASGTTWNLPDERERWRDGWMWMTDDFGAEYRYEYRPEGVYVWPTLEQAQQYANGERDIWAIEREHVPSYIDLIKDPSVAGCWEEELDWQAYVLEYVPVAALSLCTLEVELEHEGEPPLLSKHEDQLTLLDSPQPPDASLIGL